jgi:uncharacterized membrane protein
LTTQNQEPNRSSTPKKKKKLSSSELTKLLADNAIIASLYFVLTISMGSLGFQAIQFRVAEILTLLCFWRPDFIVGLTIGCLLSNVASWSPWDMLFGTLATLLANCLIAYFSHRLLFACLWPVLFNGTIIGAELTLLEINNLGIYWNMFYVAVGEAAVMVLGYVLFLSLKHYKAFWSAIKPTKHQDFKW